MAGKVNVPVTVALQGLANTQKQLGMLTKGIQGVGKTAGLAGIGFAAFAAGIKTADFAMQAISGARDLERNLLGVKTVFEELAPRMTEFSRNASDMGLGMTDAAKSVTFIGSVLKQSGFAIGETADLTERLVGLATDLSITYGYDVQEALMGMTALFRGEYDPIEKFGVAMKQSEINSELAAKGMGNLEGAQRRLAEQQVRVQLLFERSADAQGAMERGTGTLAVEQLKLAAAFENVRDTVATSMLPVIADVMMDLQDVIAELQPQIKEAFDAAAPVVERLAEDLIPMMANGLLAFVDVLTRSMDLLDDLLNPTTELGESFAAIGANFESLLYTIFGRSIGVEDVFNAIAMAVGFASDMIADIIRFIDITIIGFKAMGEMVYSFVTGDWATFFGTDWGGMITGQIAVRDAFVAQELAAKKVNEELRMQENALKKGNRAWANSWMARGDWAKAQGLVPEVVIDEGGDDDGSGDKAIKNYVKEFFDKIADEVAQNKARIKLEGLGLSEGLIEDILGGQGWQKVFNRVISSGSAGLKKLQADFNRTKAGIAELEKKRKEAADEAAAAMAVAQEIVDGLVKKFNEATEAAEEFKKSIGAIAKLDILPTFEAELGQFEDQIVSTFANIYDELDRGLTAGTILAKDFAVLDKWVKTEEAALRKIGAQRDELANRYVLAESLIAEYRSAFTAGLSLVGMMDRVEGSAEKRIVTETTKSVTKLGKTLREFGVTVTREYEETVNSVVSKSDAVLTGFRDMATKARAFADNLRSLRKLGLDPKLFAQLVEAGVEAGGETAQALVDGGAGTITEINGLFKEIDSLGKELGEEVATTLYGTGIDLANGLLAGIQSKQTELETLARTMASAFNEAFAASIKIAVQAPVQAAETASVNAKNNIENIAKINNLIGKAETWLANKNISVFEQIRTEDILDIYRGLQKDIMEGRQIDLGGIRSGMSVDELQVAARAAGGTQVVNNYDVTVNANTISGGVQAGQAFVEELKSFERNNGSVGTFLISGLA
jgi:hypothetical protein